MINNFPFFPSFYGYSYMRPRTKGYIDKHNSPVNNIQKTTIHNIIILILQIMIIVNLIVLKISITIVIIIIMITTKPALITTTSTITVATIITATVLVPIITTMNFRERKK